MRILRHSSEGFKPKNRDKKMSRRKKDELYYGKKAKSWKNKKTPWNHCDAKFMKSYLEWAQRKRDEAA